MVASGGVSSATATGNVTVRPVRGRRDIDQFIKVPFWLHQDEPAWVPPLMFERRQFLSKRRNPFFDHAEAEYFLAEREGRAVGRITAQVDFRWDEFQGGNDGMFGFFESIDDQAVADALVGAARDWVRGHGRERILGPMDFTTNDECGLLIDGYEEPPVILMNWHPPYYRGLLEKAGLQKAIDTQMWGLRMGELHEGDEFHPLIMEAARRCEQEHGVKLRSMKRSDLAAEVRRFMDIYNSAWSSNWGFVPVTDEEVEFYAKNLKPILDEDWAMIAELPDGEVVGAALSLPDINQILPDLGGRLLPLGWVRFLRGKKRDIDRVRVFALGVKPEHQHLGVAAALYVRHTEACHPDRIMSGVTGWILETNEPMNRAMEGMGGTVIQRYRIFEGAL